MNELLKQFADNERMVEAVRKVLEEQFEIDYNTFTREATAEFIGNYVRARVEGKKLLSDAFDEIESFKTFKSKPEQANPGR